MKTIHKFLLEISDHPTVSMPVGAKILKLEVQDNDAYIWALVDTNRSMVESRFFYIRGTGHNCSGLSHKQYIDTLFFESGLVFHVFKG